MLWSCLHCLVESWDLHCGPLEKEDLTAHLGLTYVQMFGNGETALPLFWSCHLESDFRAFCTLSCLHFHIPQFCTTSGLEKAETQPKNSPPSASLFSRSLDRSILSSCLTWSLCVCFVEVAHDREGCDHPLTQGDGSNESSPRPAGLGLNVHVIKPDSLNVADMGAD